MTDLITRAAEFARRAHEAIGQRRKYSGRPYLVHPQAVAEMVAAVTDDAPTIAAAWLHDVVEDTPVTIEEIAAEFGNEVAGLVADLTNVSQSSDGNRAQRKALDREHTAAADPRAKTVKLADLLHNVEDIVRHDPDFARVYVREKELTLQVLTEGDAELYEQACELITRSKHVLGMSADLEWTAVAAMPRRPARNLRPDRTSRPPGVWSPENRDR